MKKINTTTNRNDMKNASATTKGMSNEDNEKNKSSNQKCFTCQAKRCPGIKVIFFCVA